MGSSRNGSQTYTVEVQRGTPVLRVVIIGIQTSTPTERHPTMFECFIVYLDALWIHSVKIFSILVILICGNLCLKHVALICQVTEYLKTSFTSTNEEVVR